RQGGWGREREALNRVNDRQSDNRQGQSATMWIALAVLFMTLSACNRSDAPSTKQKTLGQSSKSIDAPGKEADLSDARQATEKSVAGSANTSAQDSPPIDPVFVDAAEEA